jgi:hypothetical protein
VVQANEVFAAALREVDVPARVLAKAASDTATAARATR